MGLAIEDPKHVLLAEDDDDDFFIFSLAVKDLSVRVMLTRAENGDILMKLLGEEKHPDLLFLDMLMPCRDGRTCIKEIRANAKYDAMPIIVYSSMHDLHNIQFCYREGSNLYVFKPSSIPDLKNILERIFAIDWKNMMYYPPLSEFVISA